jgi:uncharacterized protein YcfJ
MLTRAARIIAVSTLALGAAITAANADCGSAKATGTAVGAVGGGVLGNVITHGSFVGTAVGAVGGGLIGHSVGRDNGCHRHYYRHGYYDRYHHWHRYASR